MLHSSKYTLSPDCHWTRQVKCSPCNKSKLANLQQKRIRNANKELLLHKIQIVYAGEQVEGLMPSLFQLFHFLFGYP